MQEAAGIGQASGSRQQAQKSAQHQPAPTPVGAPQMILDEATGQLVLDPNSLTLQAQAPEEYTRREEGDHDVVNSMTYMKKEQATRWSAEETEEFYAVS